MKHKKNKYQTFEGNKGKLIACIRISKTWFLIIVDTARINESWVDAHSSIARKRGVETVDQEYRKLDWNVEDYVVVWFV